jgi:hypothetical protein
MLSPYVAEHYGDLASVFGLLITFGGFAATIWNVRKTKAAAEEASKAARESLGRITSQILINEVGIVLQLVRDLDSACRDQRWVFALERSDDARTHLSRLTDNPRLITSEREKIVLAIEQLLGLMTTVKNLRRSEPPKDLPISKSKQLHEIITALSKIVGRLQFDA